MCSERFGESTIRYAYEAQFGLLKTCHKEVILDLRNLLRIHHTYIGELRTSGRSVHPAEEQFIAEMNALVVRDAEEYYRIMLVEDEQSWILRDDQFARTLTEIVKHLGSMSTQGSTRSNAKVVVWARNSHIGHA